MNGDDGSEKLLFVATPILQGSLASGELSLLRNPLLATQLAPHGPQAE